MLGGIIGRLVRLLYVVLSKIYMGTIILVGLTQGTKVRKFLRYVWHSVSFSVSRSSVLSAVPPTPSSSPRPENLFLSWCHFDNTFLLFVADAAAE
jgi:hypothetical protein